MPEHAAFVRDFVARWVAAWNSHEPSRILELCTDDIRFADPAFEHEATGKTETERLIFDTITAFPDLRFEPVSGPYVEPDGERAALVWRMNATMLGPSGGFAPTGKHVDGLGVDLYEFRAGRVSAYRTIYDVADFGRQMGLIPARGSRAERASAFLQRNAMRLRRRA